MKFVLTVLITSFAVVIGAYFMPGVSVDGFTTAIIAAFILGILNAILKPILVFLTFPVTVLTFGLFLLVINAFIIQLTAHLIDRFEVSSFWAALLFSVVLSIISWLLNLPIKSKERVR